MGWEHLKDDMLLHLVLSRNSCAGMALGSLVQGVSRKEFCFDLCCALETLVPSCSLINSPGQVELWSSLLMCEAGSGLPSTYKKEQRKHQHTSMPICRHYISHKKEGISHCAEPCYCKGCDHGGSRVSLGALAARWGRELQTLLSAGWEAHKAKLKT